MRTAGAGFELHVEQPLEIALGDGGTLSAIIDHKSGAVADHAARMATYWPQLAAYVDAVEAITGKPVRQTAVFWTDTGELTTAHHPAGEVTV